MTKPAPTRAPMLLVALTSALCCAAGSSAGAVTIYRCGAAGNSFSDTPCASGQAFEVDDARSDEQRAEALRVVANDRRLAAELQAERRRAEALPSPTRAGGFNARPLQQAPAPVAFTYDGRRHSKQRPALTTRPRWIYDDREEFIAYAPPAAGKPPRQR